jgi:peptidoglycan/xylan/chitin deacetylase (PgdA/CDA1 family)
MRSRAKAWLYRIGALSTYHGRRNRDFLTAVVFHRVLPRGDARWAFADPSWTVSDVFFEECLAFFARHYNVVRAADLLDWHQAGGKLPDRSLVITIDDGWADTIECALPLLKRYRLPAILFVVAAEVDGYEPWQDTIRRAWRTREHVEDFGSLMAEATGVREPSLADPAILSRLIDRVSGLTVERRAALIGQLRRTAGDASPRQMMTLEQVRRFAECGYDLGSHGLTHTSIPRCATPLEELSGSRSKLASMLGASSDGGPTLFSFPNGRWDGPSVRLAAEAGYKVMFTSDACLNQLLHRTRVPLVLGRIDIPCQAVSGADGHLKPELLALWLFLRPACAISVEEAA